MLSKVCREQIGQQIVSYNIHKGVLFLCSVKLHMGKSKKQNK